MVSIATRETDSDAEPATGDEHASAADISTLARGGLLNLVGAATTGVFTFVLVAVLTRGLGAASYGAFVSAMGMFTVLSNTVELGADTGLVRTIARLRALDRVQDIRRTVYVALFPPMVAGTVLAVVMWKWAPLLADTFGKGTGSREIVEYARWMAPFVPAAALVHVILSGTRGFGTMVPSVLVDRAGRPILQVLLALVALAVASGNHALIALAWAMPMGLGAVIGMWWFWGLLLKAERRTRRAKGQLRPRPTRQLAAKFWRFTAPRGLAGVFQVVVLWLNTLLVGRLDSTRSAGIFNAATRYITAGLMVGVAIQQVAGPKLSELLAQRSTDRARTVYQTTTAWLMVATWPLYITFALFAPTLLRVFGEGFRGGAGALTVLGACMLVATAVGTVDMVLLMGGKSSWNLFNTVVALSSNIALNLVLIPRWGGTGAAVAWASSILFTNLAPLAQVWRFLGMHPFGRGFFRAGFAALATYGLLGVVLRFTLGTSIPVFLAYHALAGAAYLLLLVRFRHDLELPVLWTELRRRNRRKARPAA